MIDYRNRYGSREGYVRDYYDEDERYDRRRGEMDYRGRDYHSGKELSERELEYWYKDLFSEIDEKDKQFLKMDNIIKRAEDMGIEMERFTPEEFYVTVLMLFSDFSKALGTVNPDMYIKLAKAWLCDKDAAVKYGKKLSAYYNHIVQVS